LDLLSTDRLIIEQLNRFVEGVAQQAVDSRKGKALCFHKALGFCENYHIWTL